MIKIKFAFEYHCYPVWIYDEDGILIENDLPGELVNDEELNALLEKIQEKFDSLYIDDSVVFEYKGFENSEEKNMFIKDVSIAVNMLTSRLNEKYIFEDESSISSL